MSPVCFATVVAAVAVVPAAFAVAVHINLQYSDRQCQTPAAPVGYLSQPIMQLNQALSVAVAVTVELTADIAVLEGGLVVMVVVAVVVK